MRSCSSSDLLITEPALNLVKCCNELNIGYARGVGVCVVTFTVNALFNGRYVVLVAYMSVTSLLENPVLQDYLQPVVTSVDSGHPGVALIAFGMSVMLIFNLTET
ncbi:hypothetical protein JHK87_039846 [Glycine soja]|nr:hypothetical protein JHK87_039846 [Glycine soja]